MAMHDDDGPRGPRQDSRPHPYEGADFARVRAAFARRGIGLDELLDFEDVGPFGAIEALDFGNRAFTAEVAAALPAWVMRDYANSDIRHRTHAEVIVPILLDRPDCSLTMAAAMFIHLVDIFPQTFRDGAAPTKGTEQAVAAARAARRDINAGRYALDPADGDFRWDLRVFELFRDGPVQRGNRPDALDPGLLDTVIDAVRAAQPAPPSTVTVAGRVWDASEYAELLYMVRTGQRPGFFASRERKAKYRWIADHASAPRQVR